ncbi:MAG: type II toxin-antitoxin system HicA family toxin [Defluviitaleaceae bacterium]|nr:type II toxin-antitoxin system HicA family toxin [Defluviitaleaceae bacterium]
MSKKDKLIKRLKSHPKDMTFDELETLLLSLGFILHGKGKTSGSRFMFELGHISFTIHKPHPRKELAHYQIRDVLDVLESEGLI